jgi:hypothetical protein
MTDPIRTALERAARELELVATSLTQAGWTAAGGRARNESHAARTALAANPLTTRLALHPDGTPQVSIGPAVEITAAGELAAQPLAPALDIDALLSPKGAYEPGTGHEDGAQLLDQLEWWAPLYGCDTLENLLDRIRSRILPHLRPPIAGIDVPGGDGDYAGLQELCDAEGVDVRIGAPLLRRARAAWKQTPAPAEVPEIPEEVRSAFAELERRQEKLSNFRSLRESLAVDQPPAPTPASDGEREALAAWLQIQAALLRNVYTIPAGLSCAAASRQAALLESATTLLRQPAPAAVPVAVSERPWEREGWLHPEEGWCWWSACVTSWYRRGPSTVYGGSMLPHWAMPVPQPPQGGEAQP